MAWPIIGEIERLINEHASAAVLRDRLALAGEQFAAAQAKIAALELQVAQAQAHKEQLEVKLACAQLECEKLKQELEVHKGAFSNKRCTACGSGRLLRTGGKPHPVFGAVGVVVGLFRCQDCGEQVEIDLGAAP